MRVFRLLALAVVLGFAALAAPIAPWASRPAQAAPPIAASGLGLPLSAPALKDVSPAYYYYHRRHYYHRYYRRRYYHPYYYRPHYYRHYYYRRPYYRRHYYYHRRYWRRRFYY